MANYGIIRFQKIDNLGGLSGISKHNTRADQEMKSLQHINRESGGGAKILFGSGDYADEYKKSLQAHTINGKAPRTQKNCIYGWDVVTTVSKTDKAFVKNFTKWYQGTRRWMESYFGKDNVRSAIIHTDETTAHIHWFITPFHLNSAKTQYVSGAKHWTGGALKMHQLQDSYFEAVSKPLGLDRGDTKKHQKHIQPSDYNSKNAPTIKARKEFIEWFKGKTESERVDWCVKAHLRLAELTAEGKAESGTFKYYTEALNKVHDEMPELYQRLLSKSISEGAKIDLKNLPNPIVQGSDGKPKFDLTNTVQMSFGLGVMMGGIFALGISQTKEQHQPSQMTLVDYFMKVLNMDYETAQKLISKKKDSSSIELE